MKVGDTVLVVGLVILLAHWGYAETNDEKLDKMIRGMQNFSITLFEIDFLWRIENDRIQNIMLAPYSMWTSLLMMYEGAGGNTLDQLRKVLTITVGEKELKEFYLERKELVNTDSPEMEVHSYQHLYVSKMYSVNYDYKHGTDEYEMGPTVMDFGARWTQINRDITYGTNNQVYYPLKYGTVNAARMFLVSAIYFRGMWKHPFDKELTKVEPFYSERSPYKQIDKKPMMVQTGKFAYVDDLEGLDGRVLELPYGEDGAVVMLVMLPKRGFRVRHVLAQLRERGLRPILDALESGNSTKKDVEVKIPKFNANSTVAFPYYLYQLGLEDLVNSDKTNLTRLSDSPKSLRLALSNCRQFTRIIVDERGTPGSVPKPSPANKSEVVKFHVNKPFLYLVVEKKENIILFTGDIQK
ncbi:serine protease inhibitor 77Ba-like [Drosophila biarmipes]|uniref:serine protease inhibitor 77Ba-like n=1 Tax=Drosophila biarmipes TaxID=125945 RepID=UPI0007E6562E|nr:serine protease inhibitor 77Ba-like [Drosophila biarmipes]